ncbi:exocyst complex component EXO70H1-like [Vigna radiata var. radiata]|uniref:Exocyst subunit Exo70 family protein n=1 Tax=Vigna radiata var. radiata TaxID=3916 RepID=A0A1S3TLJ5_VIGRR|nr:exocyst complex component EXO70H1-like [Vigna radiata var. radiata]
MPRKGMRSIFFRPSSSPSSSTSSQPPPSPLRTFSDSLMEQNIQIAEALVTKWDDSKLGTPLFSGTRQEARKYLDAVKGLQSAMQYFVAQDSTSATLVRAQFLMQLAMKTLQREFYQILSSNRDHLDPETVSARSSIDLRSSVSEYVSDYDDEITASEDDFRISETERVSMLAMEDLKAIADCMISSGYGKECVSVYILMRKSIVDEALYHLGVEKLSLARVQKLDWEVLELKIKKWLNAVKVAVGTLFHGERILADHVFSSNPEKRISESCFAEITKDGAVSLFGFPEMVAKCKKSPEKMFRTLDLYEAISDRWTRIESIFSFESTSAIRLQAITSMVKLGEAVRTMLTDFETAIQKDSSKTTVPGGGVHPLTRYVMNYLTFLADYSGVLVDIIPDLPQSPLPESYYRSPMRDENPPASELSEKIAWLILVVLCKLDGKAEFYKSVELSYLFLANNMQYVVSKVRRSNLGFLLGEEWLAKHESKVTEYASKYERVGWSKVFASLPENPAAEVKVEQARTHFMKFDAAFHETCRKQSSWVVSDPKLRDEIKGSIGSKLMQKYSEFYEKNRVGSKSVRFILPEDIGKNLSNILCGNGDLDSVSSHSSSTTSSSHRSSRR